MIADERVRDTGSSAAGDARLSRPFPLSHLDASDPALLPEGTPIEMPEQDFSAEAARRWPRRRGPSIPRTAVFLGAGLMTAAFAHELYGVLSSAQMTPLQFLFLILSTLTFA